MLLDMTKNNYKRNISARSYLNKNANLDFIYYENNLELIQLKNEIGSKKLMITHNDYAILTNCRILIYKDKTNFLNKEKPKQNYSFQEYNFEIEGKEFRISKNSEIIKIYFFSSNEISKLWLKAIKKIQKERIINSNQKGKNKITYNSINKSDNSINNSLFQKDEKSNKIKNKTLGDYLVKNSKNSLLNCKTLNIQSRDIFNKKLTETNDSIYFNKTYKGKNYISRSISQRKLLNPKSNKKKKNQENNDLNVLMNKTDTLNKEFKEENLQKEINKSPEFKKSDEILLNENISFISSNSEIPYLNDYKYNTPNFYDEKFNNKNNQFNLNLENGSNDIEKLENLSFYNSNETFIIKSKPTYLKKIINANETNNWRKKKNFSIDIENSKINSIKYLNKGGINNQKTIIRSTLMNEINNNNIINSKLTNIKPNDNLKIENINNSKTISNNSFLSKDEIRSYNNECNSEEDIYNIEHINNSNNPIVNFGNNSGDNYEFDKNSVKEYNNNSKRNNLIDNSHTSQSVLYIDNLNSYIKFSNNNNHKYNQNSISSNSQNFNSKLFSSENENINFEISENTSRFNFSSINSKKIISNHKNSDNNLSANIYTISEDSKILFSNNNKSHRNYRINSNTRESINENTNTDNNSSYNNSNNSKISVYDNKKNNIKYIKNANIKHQYLMIQNSGLNKKYKINNSELNIISNTDCNNYSKLSNISQNSVINENNFNIVNKKISNTETQILDLNKNKKNDISNPKINNFHQRSKSSIPQQKIIFLENEYIFEKGDYIKEKKKPSKLIEELLENRYSVDMLIFSVQEKTKNSTFITRLIYNLKILLNSGSFNIVILNTLLIKFPQIYKKRIMKNDLKNFLFDYENNNLEINLKVRKLILNDIIAIKDIIKYYYEEINFYMKSKIFIENFKKFNIEMNNISRLIKI